ncbi:FIG00553480: hypothetical protein [Cronobacter condimenti 1330]|uniref:Uncharacterized protein n=1 Tax=Cronobacter condimenti 1330 TaxID=1073999 RepID=K8A1P1_9ENTR|nr:FIG00553480: hypothetical protein [Cronobacter condimenti 1330]
MLAQYRIINYLSKAYIHKLRSGGVFYCLKKTMAGKVGGIGQAKANLDKLISDVQGRKVVRAVQSALLIGGAQAALYTPIDTSTLLNSQFREMTPTAQRCLAGWATQSTMRFMFTIRMSRKPNVAVVRPGDGYEQRQVKGINPLMDKYSLVIRGTDDNCRINPVKLSTRS